MTASGRLGVAHRRPWPHPRPDGPLRTPPTYRNMPAETLTSAPKAVFGGVQVTALAEGAAETGDGR